MSFAMPLPQSISAPTAVFAATARAWHLGRFPSLAILGAVGILLVLYGLAYRGSRDSGTTIEVTLRNYAVMRLLEQLQNAVDEAHLDMRGYLLTGDAAYRQAWSRKTAEIDRKLTLLAATLPSDHGDWLEMLRTKIAARIAWSTESVRVHDAEGPAASAARVASGRGEALSREIRSAIEANLERHYARIQVQLASSRQSAALVSLLLPLGTGVSLATLAGSMLLLNRTAERQLRAEAQLRQLNSGLEDHVRARTAQLEAANRELEAFSYSVSHDLRAPLRGISGFVTILEEDYGPRLDAEGRRVLDIIARDTKRMGQLIDDLLAFSRLKRQSLESGRIDMARLAEEVWLEITGQHTGTVPRFQLGELPAAQGDRATLRQVWMNLLSNAVKFTSGTPDPVVTVSGATNAGRHTYRVQDNGVGFDPRFTSKLFGVFSRLHSEDEFEGTGVGLAIVQRIVHRHGGDVNAESQPGCGATFAFSLPAQAGPLS